MSRIEDAFRRIARREVGESGAKPSLERFTFEEAPAGAHAAPVPPAPWRSEPPRTPPAASGSDPADSDEALVDFRQIGDYIGFVGRSVIRHPFLALLTFVLMVGATAGAVAAWPRTYHVEARLLAQPNSLMNSMGTPSHSGPPSSSDSPTFAVSETILRRDNLASLIKQTDLLNEWQRTRPRVLRLKDRVMLAIGKEPSNADRIDAMSGLLEQRLKVDVPTEGTVVIMLDWPDGHMAYELVSTALQNFLDARQAGESAVLNDSITVLERYAATLENDVNATFADVQAEQAKRGVGARALDVRRTAASGATSAAGAPAAAEPAAATGLAAPPPELLVRLGRLRTALDAKRGEVARLEETKAQSVSDVQNRLAAALTIYTEGHPMVTSLKQALATASRDSPQLQQARAEALTLERDYVSLAAAQEKVAAPATAGAAVDARKQPPAAGTRPAPTATVLPVPDHAAEASAAAVGPQAGPNDYSSLNSVRLRLQVAQLGEIRDRIAAARLALATSQAGFKYQFTLTRPPQVPRGPIKPIVPLVVAAGIIAAMVLAVLAALCRDLLSGRIVEAWQVERQVGVAVLGRVRGV